jgi:uncharacterized protein
MIYFNQEQKYIIDSLFAIIEKEYGDNLVSLAVYGSYSRGDARPGSDIDLFIILKNKSGNFKEQNRFYDNVEHPLEADMNRLYELYGIAMDISPLIVSKERSAFFHPLYLDMSENAEIIHDTDGWMRNLLDKTADYGARFHFKRSEFGNTHVWDMGMNSLYGVRL